MKNIDECDDVEENLYETLGPQQVNFSKTIEETEINETLNEDIKKKYLDNRAYVLHKKFTTPDVYM